MSLQREVIFETNGRGAYDVTSLVSKQVEESRIDAGLCHVFIRHTSASLMICENADPDVLRDLEAFLAKLVPDGDPMFRHTAEGPDDMPAHVRSVLTSSSLSIPVIDGRCALGAWQGVFLCEHRHSAHRRKLVVSVQPL